MEMDHRSSNISPLNENNYPTWKIQVRMLLMKENLLDIVEGRELAPTGNGGESAPNRDALNKFNIRKNRALAIVVLHVDPKLLYLIGEPQDPVQVWSKLQETFQRKSWANKLRLRKKLYGMKLEPGDDLQQHLKTFVEIFDALAVVGDAMEEEDRVISVLASLPDTYSTLVTALEAAEKVPSWEVMTERLLHEETKARTAGEVSSVEEKSLITKGKGNVRNFRCFECNKIGHMRRNCNIFKERMKNSKYNKSKFSANTARNRYISDDEVVLSTSTVSALTSKVNLNSFIIDSGATQHMCYNRDMFFNYSELENKLNVHVGNGSVLTAIGSGDLQIKLKLPTERLISCTLRNVLYVPGLAYNLISVSQVTRDGKQIQFYNNSCKILNNGKMIAFGSKVDNLYMLDCIKEESCLASKTNDSSLLHRRFCHQNFKSLQNMITNQLVRGIDKSIILDSDFCADCCSGKIHKNSFPPNDHDNERYGPLDLIHTDVCGKIVPQSIGGGLYYVTFIDHFSRFCWIYVLNKKSQVFEKFKEFKSMVENLYQRQIKILRSDNGGEYTSTQFEIFLKENGIVHQTTVSKTPEQNGMAERKNRSLIEIVRCLLSDSQLSKSFWAEALNTANYVLNRSPSSGLHGKMTPYEKLNGLKPKVDYFRVFGCECYMHVPSDERVKLDSKSQKCIFLGYSNVKKGYRLFNISTKKIVFSRDVVFNETKIPKNSKCHGDTISDEIQYNPDLNYSYENDITEQADDGDQFEDALDEIRPSRPVRDRRPPDRFGDWVCFASSDTEPKTVDEALGCSESSYWLAAMKNEINAMELNHVWDLVLPNSDENILKSKWIFKRKVSHDGTISYKARLVAQGFNQQPGIDYEETFSPVARFESIRALLAIAAKNGLKIKHMDVSSAFF